MDVKRISKFMSYVLRHRPDAIALNMNPQGWVDLDELIEKMNQKGYTVDVATIQTVVAENNKQRFKLDLEGRRIRANQGHSIAVDVELEQKTPPSILYHGSAQKNEGSILKEGLKKMNRQHVHLSSDIATAKQVGGRHGKPVVFVVRCDEMVADGLTFYLSENQVWLTTSVDSKYIELLKQK